MIILKGYKDNSLREEDVLTLIETIMDNYATNTISIMRIKQKHS